MTGGSRHIWGLAIAATLVTGSADAGNRDAGWEVDAGISHVQLQPDLPRDLRIHTTHPDDQVFLSGSAGETDLDEVDITFLNLSLGHTWAIEGDRVQVNRGWKWGVSYVLKVPLEEDGREDIQNVNDFRPATEGSFIYTGITDVDVQHEIGVHISYWRDTGSLRYAVTPGIFVGYWKMSFEKGWDRFGRDEPELSSEAKGISISPQIQASLGTPDMKVGIFLAYRAVDLEYDTTELGSSVAQAMEIGASFGWSF